MSPITRVDERSQFWFGVSVSGVLFVAAAMMAWRGLASGWIWALVGAGATLLVANRYVPAVRGRLYRGVRAVTYPIHVVVTYTLLAAIYYLLVTPLGLVLRLRGRDTMSVRAASRSPSSFWQQRDAPAERNRYFKTF